MLRKGKERPFEVYADREVVTMSSKQHGLASRIFTLSRTPSILDWLQMCPLDCVLGGFAEQDTPPCSSSYHASREGVRNLDGERGLGG